MAKPASVVGSVTFGVCSCHSPSPITTSGVIVSGAGNVLASGSPMAFIGSTVIAGCGHSATVISGVGNVIVAGSPASGPGDRCVGCYNATIVSGLGNVII